MFDAIALPPMRGQAPPPSGTEVDDPDELPIPGDIAARMLEFIESKLGTPYLTNDPLTIISASAAELKGSTGRFICTGLIEAAAENAGYQFGRGFIPPIIEDAAGFASMSPTMLRYAMQHQELLHGIQDANNVVNLLHGFIDPVDFIMTDPLGRRFGYTGATGYIAEIPDIIFFGDGVERQFLLPTPHPGEYRFDLFGLGEEALVRIGTEQSSLRFKSVLEPTNTTTLRFTVVPEPSTFVLLMCCMASCVLIKRQWRRVISTVKVSQHLL